MNELFILDYMDQLILEALNYMWIQYGFHKTRRATLIIQKAKIYLKFHIQE